MERREFIKICAATAAMAAGKTFALTNTEPRFYSRARLVDYDGRAVKASGLQIKQNYIFHYPFQGTPCFLLNLGKPTTSEAMLLTADGKKAITGKAGWAQTIPLSPIPQSAPTALPTPLSKSVLLASAATSAQMLGRPT